MVDDVKLALDCGVKGVVMEVPSSRHLIELGYRWSVERAIELSVEATNFAHENGLLVSFFPIDATRASLDDYLNLIGRVASDGHMDALVLVDTFGVLAPHAVERFVKVSRDRFNVPLETHFHMDYGLGIANSLIAAAYGASVIQTTVTGIGERAGNVPVEETVMALLTLYDMDIGIKTEKLFALAGLIAELSGVRQAPNRAVVGESLFEVESGIIATWVRNVREDALTNACPTTPRSSVRPGPASFSARAAESTTSPNTSRSWASRRPTSRSRRSWSRSRLPHSPRRPFWTSTSSRRSPTRRWPDGASAWHAGPLLR